MRKLMVLFMLFLFSINIKANNLILILNQSEYKVGDEIVLTAKFNSLEQAKVQFFVNSEVVELEQSEKIVEGQETPILVSVKGKVKTNGKVVVGVEVNQQQASIPLEVKGSEYTTTHTLDVDLSKVGIKEQTYQFNNQTYTLLIPKFNQIPKGFSFVNDKLVNANQVQILTLADQNNKVYFFYEKDGKLEIIQRLGQNITQPLFKEKMEVIKVGNHLYSTYKENQVNLIQFEDGLYKYNVDKKLFEPYVKEEVKEEVKPTQPTKELIDPFLIILLLIVSNVVTVILLILILIFYRRNRVVPFEEVYTEDFKPYVDEEEIKRLDDTPIEEIQYPKFKGEDE